MEKTTYRINGKGLFSKDEVVISIGKGKENSGIIFLINNQTIRANVENVTNSIRNTVLSSGNESICLVEHFLGACSLMGISDIEVETNKNELIFNDGSAMHYYEAFLANGFSLPDIQEEYSLQTPIFVKNDRASLCALPHDGFKISYFMHYEKYPHLSKLFASFEKKDQLEKILRARTFGTKEENEFYDVSDRLLTLTPTGFSKKLHEPLEPLHHKILDIIGDLRLSGINPLEINMHVIGIKSGHELNVEMARELKKQLL